MYIGIVTYYLDIGGVEIVLEMLSKHFIIEQGHQVEIIETLSKGRESDTFKSKGFSVKTITINSLESKNHFAKRLANSLKKYDVLLLNNVPFVHYLLGLLREETIVLPILHNNIDDFYHNILLNKKQWDSIVCVSPILEKLFKEMKEFNNEKIAIIPNGIHVTQHYPKKTKKTTNKISLLFVGRIEEKQKGVLLLPKIISKVLEEKNTNKIHLKIIGEGESLKALKKAITKAKLNRYISFLGSLEHDKVLKEIHKADILIMPSYYEGQGLVYLEAMAQGTIPLVSNLKNNTDLVIQHKKNGFLCPIGDIDCFAQQILYLFDNPQEIASISKKAWNTAYTSLRSEIMAQKYLELINKLKENRTIVRSNRLEKIPYGNLPYILVKFINLNNKIKIKIRVLFYGD